MIENELTQKDDIDELKVGFFSILSLFFRRSIYKNHYKEKVKKCQFLYYLE